jgi:hypothetical protein
MRESHKKGVASHPDPESCAVSRKAEREALTMVRAGRVIRRTLCSQKPVGPWNLHAREPGEPINARRCVTAIGG